MKEKIIKKRILQEFFSPLAISIGCNFEYKIKKKNLTDKSSSVNFVKKNKKLQGLNLIKNEELLFDDKELTSNAESLIKESSCHYYLGF